MFKVNISYKAIACLFIVALSACGKSEDKKSLGQVAAKVDGTEISLLQINQVMRSAKNVTSENAPAMRQQVLEKLIDQQIVVDKALKENLDRTPDVMIAIESAKKDILARAYLQKMVSSGVKVTDLEVKKYYDEHPELFSKRRIYNLQDIGLEKNDSLFSSLKAQIEQQKSMQEIADGLKNQNIKFSAGSYTRPAEQIPLEILPKLQQLQDGGVVVLEVANALHVIKIVKSQEAPIDFSAATPFIKNYFINTKGKQVVDDEMNKYRAEAHIEYMGGFAVKNKTGDTAQQVIQTAPNSKQGEKSELDKGIAGLK